MARSSSRSVGIALVLAFVAAPVAAEPVAGNPHPYPVGTHLGTTRQIVLEPAKAFTGNSGANVSPLIYLNRCTGGCMVTKSDHNDAHNHLATMVTTGILGEFANDMGQTGAAADAEWAQIVQCVKEVYSPFNLTVTDQLPPSNVNWTEGMVGGQPTDLGFPTDVLGIAPAHIDCNAYDNAIAFSFANHEPGSGLSRVYNICWTIAQETAHNFGLDHEYQFSDGGSACNDPMTYRTDCGGQKFFRNKGALCGENAVRACFCPGNQNSHQKILSTFGAGTVITPPPVVSVVFPANGANLSSGQAVQAQAFSQRGVEHVDLYLNNHLWGTVKGAVFGPNGQDMTTYPLPIPSTVPNSVIDIVAKAYDDLGAETDSATVTVTKGAPCADATTCLKGQLCQAGKCFWNPPTGEIGVKCDYNEFCISGVCAGTNTDQICTQNCIVGSTDACPTGYDCLATSASMGICFPPDTGGCCSVGHDAGHAMWIHASLGALVLGLVLRRRRRRR